VLTDSTFDMDTADNGRIVRKTVPALSALNERLRNDYVEDCARGLMRWKPGDLAGRHRSSLNCRTRAFNRRIGSLPNCMSRPRQVMSDAEWKATSTSAATARIAPS